MFLVAEYCAADMFEGWHLYLRDTARRQRNADGSWGWIRSRECRAACLAKFGIELRGDGTTDDDGVAEFAKRFQVDTTAGGRPRGCVEFEADEETETDWVLDPRVRSLNRIIDGAKRKFSGKFSGVASCPFCGNKSLRLSQIVYRGSGRIRAGCSTDGCKCPRVME